MERNSQPDLEGSDNEHVSSVEDMTPEQRAGMLATMVHASDPRVRKSVAIALGSLNTAAATGPLCEMLDDEDEGVRVLVCQALGRLRDPACLGPLCAHAHDESAQVRSGVLFVLASLAAYEALPAEQRGSLFTPMVVMAFDPDDGVRADAAATLGTLRDERTTEPLCVLASDDNPRVRANACSSLGFTDGQQGSTALMERALDSNEDILVRISALDALGHRAERGLFDGAARDDAVIRVVREACAIASGKQATTTPQKPTSTQTPTNEQQSQCQSQPQDQPQDQYQQAPSNGDLRATAVWALGMLGSLPLSDDVRGDVLGVLESVTQQAGSQDAQWQDSDSWSLRYAIEALARIGGDRAQAALQELARRGDTGEIMLTPEVADVLTQALNLI